MAVQGDTIGGLTEATSAAGEDWIELEIKASGLSRKINKDNYIGASLVGGGAIATGGFTLTVPATGTAALLAAMNIFTANQRVNALVGVNKAPASAAQVDILSGAAGRHGLRLDTAASPTSAAMLIMENGVQRVGFLSSDSADAFNNLQGVALHAFNNGSNAGPRVAIGRNSNGSTPAAGHLALRNLSNTAYRIWPDASGDLRIHTSDPTNANDTSGTVVGSQSSWIGLKKDVELWSGDDALSTILETPLYSYQLRDDAGNPGRVYRGLVIESRDEWFAENTQENQTPALDERTLFGYLIAGIQALTARVAELEAKLDG